MSAQPTDETPTDKEVLQHAYDLIMLLAFAKPEAKEGVPKTFTVLDELRAALARPAEEERR